MARGWAALTLGAVVLATAGGIAYIHHSQNVERQVCCQRARFSVIAVVISA